MLWEHDNPAVRTHGDLTT